MELKAIQEELKKSPAFSLWQKVGIFPHHGIALPLSSIHTQKSCGIGEFLDLLPLIDWCKEVGFDLIQLLPLNDTSDDSSPYYAISSCALNPIYISCQELLEEKSDEKLKSDLKEMQTLTSEEEVPYKVLYAKKQWWLWQYFLSQKNALEKDKNFADFLSQNRWLEAYSLFLILAEEEKTYDWQQWPQELQNLSQERIWYLLQQHQEKFFFYGYVQYLAISQMVRVKEYATKQKILLMGDLPILISPHSADVFCHRSLFDLNYSAGAPPDSFNLEGQKWNFPIFQWEEMKKNGYAWWQERLEVAARFYHLYRIDHVVGFFRMWAIERSKTAKEGFYLPKEKALWKKEGEEHLKALLSFSSILPIAEDLGRIPQETFDTLKELGICGTRVMRWLFPKKIEEYDALSLTTLSTHDTETLQGWWQKEPKKSQLLAKEKGWNYSPHLSFEQRKELLQDAHHTSSLFHVNLLQEYLALFENLIWGSAEKERINVPGKVLKTNWCYRYRPSLEELLHQEELKREIREILFS